MSKTPTIKLAARIARNAAFFIRFGGSLLRKTENLKAEIIATTMEQLMQISNLRCNGREATARLSNLWTLIKKAGTQDRDLVSFPVFLNSRFVVIC